MPPFKALLGNTAQTIQYAYTWVAKIWRLKIKAKVERYALYAPDNLALAVSQLNAVMVGYDFATVR